MPVISHQAGDYCGTLGQNYQHALLKFRTAQEPPAGEPALFVMRIKGEFTEYPTRNNIGQIQAEIDGILRSHGLNDFIHDQTQDVCWRAKLSNLWEHDVIEPPDPHHYTQVMRDQADQKVGGEALLAYQIPASERDKLPGVRAEIDSLIAERLERRQQAFAK